jgi:indolepyruvate ferredoxin oxidoreductase
MRAIELNGVQADNNKAAFELGRRLAHAPTAARLLAGTAQVIEFVKAPSLEELVATRVAFLTAYQNAAYAAQYRGFVDKVRAAESGLASTALAGAVARCLFKLMAYKDEYEVARLHTDPGFTAKVEAMFEGEVRLVHHLAPPLLARKTPRGELVKRPFGPWVRKAFRALAMLKALRGTALDPFALSEERKTERALIAEYRGCIEEILSSLTRERLDLALAIARLPEEIRGYGHVKARHLEAVRPKWSRLMAQWRSAITLPQTAIPAERRKTQ